MVLGQELACGICQLQGPGIQATQVQLIKQFTVSLPNCQPRGMGIMGLISSPQQLLTLRGFRHRQCSYFPGHWGFLSEGLQVCHVIPYHHNCLFAAFPQLGVHVLHHEALWQRTVLSMHDLYHDVNAFFHIGPPCPHWHDLRREGLYGLHILGVHQLVIAIHINSLFLAISHFHGHHPTH